MNNVRKVGSGIRALRTVRLESDVQAKTFLPFPCFEYTGALAAPISGKIETNTLGGIANPIFRELHR
jgi:hypothetical protein